MRHLKILISVVSNGINWRNKKNRIAKIQFNLCTHSSNFLPDFEIEFHL